MATDRLSLPWNHSWEGGDSSSAPFVVLADHPLSRQGHAHTCLTHPDVPEVTSKYLTTRVAGAPCNENEGPSVTARGPGPARGSALRCWSVGRCGVLRRWLTAAKAAVGPLGECEVAAIEKCAGNYCHVLTTATAASVHVGWASALLLSASQTRLAGCKHMSVRGHVCVSSTVGPCVQHGE